MTTRLLPHVRTSARPDTVPCRITGSKLGTLDVTGIPGAAAATAMLRHEYGLDACWTPLGVVTETPYAFVVLDSHIHVAWFPVDEYVSDDVLTACGRRITTSEPLLSQPKSPDAVGLCPGCLTVWGLHYGH